MIVRPLFLNNSGLFLWHSFMAAPDFWIEAQTGQLVVVHMHVALDGLLHVLAIDEAVCSQDIFNSPIEALDHPIGLRASGFGLRALGLGVWSGLPPGSRSGK